MLLLFARSLAGLGGGFPVTVGDDNDELFLGFGGNEGFVELTTLFLFALFARVLACICGRGSGLGFGVATGRVLDLLEPDPSSSIAPRSLPQMRC